MQGEILDYLQTKFLEVNRANGNIITLTLENEVLPLEEISDGESWLRRFPILSAFKEQIDKFLDAVKKRVDGIIEKIKAENLFNRGRLHSRESQILYLETGKRVYQEGGHE